MNFVRGSGTVALRLGTALRLVLSASLVATSVSACANGGRTLFSSGIDAGDACGREHAAFEDSKSFYFQQVVQGALLGAVAGAVLGAAAAAGSRNNVAKGAAIGAGAGAVAGGTAGYFNARQQQAYDEAALTNSIYGDVTRASQEMDRASTTFTALSACRFAAAGRIKAASRQGTLSRAQAAMQLDDQKRRFDEELALARDYGAKMAEQDQQFRFAADSLVKTDPEAQQTLAARAAQRGAGDYLATAAVTLRSAPDAASDRVGALHRGQRVRSVGAGAGSADWHHVVLGDGTSGYVPARYLKSAVPAQAAATPPAPAVVDPPPPANRKAQVAVAATETIPEKRAAYGQAVQQASEQSGLSFNLDQTS